ncbi:MAG: lamin tail domain-containing protein, partial [Bacteroidia bacterium]
MMKLYSRFIFCCFLLSFFHVNAQILINEVSSASVSTYLDEDNSQEDWIEFYNSSPVAINMNGYKITSQENGKNNSWTFPSIIIKPHNYLTIFCSGKNRKAYFDHWEVPVYANNPWKYFLGTTDPPTTWRSIAF